jgi:hypothetical protein
VVNWSGISSAKCLPGLGFNFNFYEMYYLLVLFSLSLSKSLAVNSELKFLWIPGGFQVTPGGVQVESRCHLWLNSQYITSVKRAALSDVFDCLWKDDKTQKDVKTQRQNNFGKLGTLYFPKTFGNF